MMSLRIIVEAQNGRSIAGLATPADPNRSHIEHEGGGDRIGAWNPRGNPVGLAAYPLETPH